MSVNYIINYHLRIVLAKHYMSIWPIDMVVPNFSRKALATEMKKVLV